MPDIVLVLCDNVLGHTVEYNLHNTRLQNWLTCMINDKRVEGVIHSLGEKRVESDERIDGKIREIGQNIFRTLVETERKSS